jgi:sugar phosphate isomerase/epimerase
MKLLTSTYMFWQERLSPVHLGLIKDSGFSALEIFCFRQHFDWQDGRQRSEIKQAANDLGLEIDSFHAPYDEEGSYDISSLEHRRRLKAVEGVKAALECLAALNGNRIVIHSGLAEVKDRQEAALVGSSLQSLETLAGYAGELGVELALENSPPPALGSTARQIEEILSNLRAYSISFCLDTGHANLAAGGIQGFIIPALKPAEVHLSDNLGEQDDHLAPGKGTIDWRQILTAMVSCLGAGIEQLGFAFELGAFPGETAFGELRRWWEASIRRAVAGGRSHG